VAESTFSVRPSSVSVFAERSNRSMRPASCLPDVLVPDDVLALVSVPVVPELPYVELPGVLEVPVPAVLPVLPLVPVLPVVPELPMLPVPLDELVELGVLLVPEELEPIEPCCESLVFPVLPLLVELLPPLVPPPPLVPCAAARPPAKVSSPAASATQAPHPIFLMCISPHPLRMVGLTLGTATQRRQGRCQTALLPERTSSIFSRRSDARRAPRL
jgi:hypothetical protein